MTKYLFLFLVLFNFGCANTPNDGILSFDISKNNPQIVYSYKQKENIFLCLSDIQGKNLKPINLQQGFSYVSPRFSENGKKIVYVKIDEKTSENSLAYFDIENKHETVLATVDGFISEVKMSNDLKSIYFTKANYYQSNSPIAKKSLRGFDLYELLISNKEIKKLTLLDSYGMHNIYELDPQNILLNIESSEGGIYIFSKNDNSLTKLKMRDKNGEINLEIFYSGFSKVDNDRIVVRNNYHIEILDYNKKQVKNIYLSDSQIKCLDYYDNIYFVTREKPQILNLLSLQGKLLEEIQVEIIN